MAVGSPDEERTAQAGFWPAILEPEDLQRSHECELVSL